MLDSSGKLGRRKAMKAQARSRIVYTYIPLRIVYAYIPVRCQLGGFLSVGAPLPSQVIELSGIRKVEVYPIELLLVQHSDMETALTIQFSYSDSVGESQGLWDQFLFLIMGPISVTQGFVGISLQPPEKAPVKLWRKVVVTKLSTDTGCLLESLKRSHILVAWVGVEMSLFIGRVSSSELRVENDLRIQCIGQVSKVYENELALSHG